MPRGRKLGLPLLIAKPLFGTRLPPALRAAADQMSYAGADEAATWLNEIAAELDSANNTRGERRHLA
jgi:hypothetical protein